MISFKETKASPKAGRDNSIKPQAEAGAKPKGRRGSAKAETPQDDEPKPKHAGGRPRVVGEPWIEAGVSRRTWYRRKAEEKSRCP